MWNYKKSIIFSFSTFGMIIVFVFLFNIKNASAAICRCPDSCIASTDASICSLRAGCTYIVCERFPESPAAPVPAPTTPAPTGATSPETVPLTNPLKGNITDVPTLVGMIIKAALGIIGAVSIFVFIVGGFKWLTSLGNQEKISAGAKTMLWAVLGLVVTFASYLVINLLLKV